MFKNLSLKTKFTLIMTIVGFAAILASLIWTLSLFHYFGRKVLIHEAHIILNFERSTRYYVSQKLRPAAINRNNNFNKLPYDADDIGRNAKLQRMISDNNDFDIRAYSGTSVAMHVGKYMREFVPPFIYSEPALSPLNLRDKANPFEISAIGKFKSNPSLKSVSGFHVFNGKSYFYLMLPVIVKKSCMVCHGNPSNPSPITAAVVKRYGDTHGWHWKVGTTAGVLSVLVPTKHRANIALHNAIIITAAFLILFLLAFIIAIYFINKAIIKPIHEMTKLAEDVSVGKSNEDFKVKGDDEIGTLAKSFNRLKTSYLKAIQLLADRNKEKK